MTSAAGRYTTAAVVLVLGLAAVAGIVAWGNRGVDDGATPRAGIATAGRSDPQAPSSAPTEAVREVLHLRSQAVLAHDRAAFMATIDPDHGAFRAEQRRMFANLADVPFASWSYTVGAGAERVSAARRAAYAAPTWAPTGVALHYRLRGFDRAPTDLAEYPTFVERSGRWYLTSLRDFTARGEFSATDLWDYGPVRVIRRPRVLVLGPPSELATMRDAARRAAAAIPAVNAVWGRHWARRAVVLVPSSQHELALIDDDHAGLRQIAALTSAEIQTARGRASPVGDRITINPRPWATLTPAGRSVVLTHELTHVASRADTGAQTPKWLVEGLAEYVSFRDSAAAPPVIAAELATALRHGHALGGLPSDSAFLTAGEALPEAYEKAWLACRYIAGRYGVHRLVAFYRAVGTSHAQPATALRRALRADLHLDLRSFTDRWRHYVRRVLG